MNGEKYRVNPTKGNTSVGALARIPYGCGGISATANKSKPESEVITRFTVYGKERIRFKACDECRRLSRKVYRKKKEAV